MTAAATQGIATRGYAVENKDAEFAPFEFARREVVSEQFVAVVDKRAFGLVTKSDGRRTLIEFPWMTAKVITAIHWEALRLWRKGVPIQPFPQPDDRHRREDNTDGISRFLGRAGRLARVRGH